MPQQELAQPVSSVQVVLLRHFPCPYQVAQRLVGRVRYPNRRKISGPIAPLLGVAAIGLDSIPQPLPARAWGDDFTIHAQGRELPAPLGDPRTDPGAI